MLQGDPELEEEGGCVNGCNIMGASQGLDHILLSGQRIVVRDRDLIDGAEINHNSALGLAVNLLPDHKDGGSKGARSLDPFQSPLSVESIELFVDKLPVFQSGRIGALSNRLFMP